MHSDPQGVTLESRKLVSGRVVNCLAFSLYRHSWSGFFCVFFSAVLVPGFLVLSVLKKFSECFPLKLSLPVISQHQIEPCLHSMHLQMKPHLPTVQHCWVPQSLDWVMVLPDSKYLPEFRD